MAASRDGTLVVNARPNRGRHWRMVALSRDGGQTWSPAVEDKALTEPVCQGSLLAANDEAGREVFLFSNPAAVRRERLSVRLSLDGGRTWPLLQLLYDGPSAYSDLCRLGNETFGCLYERDGYKRLTFARFSLQQLRQGPGEKTKGGVQ